jgi:hypothetical protein
LQKLRTALFLKGGSGRSFEYLARTIVITDDTITVSQAKFAATLEPVFIPKERRCKPDSPLTPEENRIQRLERLVVLVGSADTTGHCGRSEQVSTESREGDDSGPHAGESDRF